MALIKTLDTGVSTATAYSYTANTPTVTVLNFPTQRGCKTLACQAVVTVTTPANKTWTNANVSGNNITITAHGFATGLACTLTTGGTLPTGLSTSTTYYIIVIDANTIAFATSLANAKTATAITLTGSGSGTSTVNVTALAGGTLKLQKSIDGGTTWYDEGSAQNVTQAGSFYFEKADPCATSYSILVTLTAGQLTVSTQYVGIGFN